ncbi:MAG: hypothetical protein WC734_06135 [Patescibacteria group bacterium]|jgi:hypothetical protein
MAGDFNQRTRQKFSTLSALAKPLGGGQVQMALPKSGFLGRIWLSIRATIGGAPVAPLNPLGVSSIINRVRVTLNTGIDVFNVSGPGYAWLLDEMLDAEFARGTPQNQGRSLVAAGTYNLDMVIPLMMNLRDAVGLLLLQNEQLTATLTVDFAADATVAAGAVITATVTPIVENFTVPLAKEDFPSTDLLHTVLEESSAVAAAGELTYNIPRGNVYLQIAQGLGMGVAGADNFDRVRIRVNQSDYITDVPPAFLDMQHGLYRGRARPAGCIYTDLMGSSGLGMYGTGRDLFNSALVTDFAMTFNALAAGTLYTVRRQLVNVPRT